MYSLQKCFTNALILFYSFHNYLYYTYHHEYKLSSLNVDFDKLYVLLSQFSQKQNQQEYICIYRQIAREIYNRIKERKKEGKEGWKERKERGRKERRMFDKGLGHVIMEVQKFYKLSSINWGSRNIIDIFLIQTLKPENK